MRKLRTLIRGVLPNTIHHKKELIFSKIKKIIKTLIFSLAKLLAIRRSRIAALEFYASVREAAKRRVDAAETLFNALSPFFKPQGRRNAEEGEQPTKKQALRDFKALEEGKHDGKLIIENEKPKLTGGSRKIIDETFKDTAKFKGSVDGEVTE